MSLYVISYDLVAQGRNYEPLYSEFLRLGATRVLLSQWLVRSDSSAVQLRDHFRQYMDGNDRILVNAIDTTWAGYNLLANPNHL